MLVVPDSEAPLEFGVDLNATRYADGVKETANGQANLLPLLEALWAPHWHSNTQRNQLFWLSRLHGMEAFALNRPWEAASTCTLP